MTGQFNVVKFYETFAAIIAEREQVKITVTVTRKEDSGDSDSSNIAETGANFFSSQQHKTCCIASQNATKTERNELTDENQNPEKQATTSTSFAKCQFDV